MKTPERAQVHSDTFLSYEETIDLTGYKSPKKQCEHLRANGIPFFVNGRGYPRIIRETLNGGGRQAKAKPEKSWQPAITA